jgi:pimeloyl-ACP methyl ester carboxylesterase
MTAWRGVRRVGPGAAAATVLVAVALPAAVGGAPAQPDLRGFYRQQVSWTPCPGDQPEERGWPEQAACGTVRVPLDYANPAHGTAELLLNRFPATGPGPRLGSLLVNFGGPGISGVTTLADQAGGELTRLNTRYDLVGFDPRGVGGSTAVDCGDLSGVTATDQVGKARQLARACRASSGALLPWVGTTNAARDLDVMRQTLGDDRLSYLGFSYGSKLGAVYAHEFPGRTGRMVLDGVPDPTLDEAGTALAQTTAFQQALADFAADCAAHAHPCPLPGRTAGQVLAGISATAPTTPLGDLDRDGYLQGVQNALYSKETWPYLRQALSEMRHGDGTLMLQLAYPGAFGQAAEGGSADNYEAAKLAIDCRDTPERPTAAAVHRRDAAFNAASPLFGASIEATLLSCTGWAPGDDSSRRVAAPGAPRTLLVSTTGDPATPYRGAAHMAAALGNGSRVLPFHGEGHGAYFAHSRCVTSAVDGYLLRGAFPKAGAAC